MPLSWTNHGLMTPHIGPASARQRFSSPRAKRAAFVWSRSIWDGFTSLTLLELARRGDTVRAIGFNGFHLHFKAFNFLVVRGTGPAANE